MVTAARRSIPDAWLAEGKPARVAVRKWRMYVSHVRDGRRYVDIGHEHGVTGAVVRQCVIEVSHRLQWLHRVEP